MARYFPAAVAALAALCLTAPACVHAQTAAFTLAPPFNDYTPPAASQEMGYIFTVSNAPVPVYGLGFYDSTIVRNLPPGLNESHAVGIFDTSGNLLVQGTVLAGTASPLVGNFRYTTQLFNGSNSPLTAPYSLPLGAYIIEAISQTDHYVYGGGSSITSIPNVTFGGSRYKFNVTTLSGSSLTNDGTFGYFGGNFLNTPFPSVPEPGSTALLGSGLIAFGLTWRKRVRKSRSAA